MRLANKRLERTSEKRGLWLNVEPLSGPASCDEWTSANCSTSEVERVPVVRLKGWVSGQVPAAIPPSLIELLAEPTSMNGAELFDALRGLSMKCPIDAYFDFGEEEAAQEFIQVLRPYGVRTHLLQDGETPADDEQRAEQLQKVAIFAVPTAMIVLGLIVWEPWTIAVLAAIGVAGAGFAVFFRKAG